jgi:hypothetical protein
VGAKRRFVVVVFIISSAASAENFVHFIGTVLTPRVRARPSPVFIGEAVRKFIHGLGDPSLIGTKPRICILNHETLAAKGTGIPMAIFGNLVSLTRARRFPSFLFNFRRGEYVRRSSFARLSLSCIFVGRRDLGRR